MFARGVVHLHAAHLPVPKSLAAKSSVSVSSKLIEIKGFQLHYFGHLRKTGGRGSYRLVYTPPHLGRNSPSLSPIIPALARPSLNLFLCYVLPATGGRVPLVIPRFTAKPARLRPFDSAQGKRRPLQQRRAGWPRPAPTTPTSFPLSVSTRQYCAAIAPNLGKTEPRRIPAWSGSPRCGYVPFADRCPDAHD